MLLVAFKMLEMHARRDLFVVIFLNFFLPLTNFFYSQSIGTGVMMVGAIVALLTAQLSFQYTGAVPPLGRRLRLGAAILASPRRWHWPCSSCSPRVQGPLWGMPGDANSGRTGLSSSMAPGNISTLAQSSEMAFRAAFRQRTAGPGAVYWRGIVLDRFDGRAWTASGQAGTTVAYARCARLAPGPLPSHPGAAAGTLAIRAGHAGTPPTLFDTGVELSDERELRASAASHSTLALRRHLRSRLSA